MSTSRSAIRFFQKTKLPMLMALCAVLFLIAAAKPTPVTAEAASSEIGSSPLPGLIGATSWINSPPLTAKQLKGKVVLVDFWDYSCINCLRSLPYINAWAAKYKDSGLVVIGVHTPEFSFEKELPNVQKAVKKYAITYPVALDNNYAIWNAFHNEGWPVHYFIDANGKVRFMRFGEGEYGQSEKWIQQLLKERNEAKVMPSGIVSVHGRGAQAAADVGQIESNETYIGYERAENFASPGGLQQDSENLYALPEHLALNEWGLSGQWIDHDQVAILRSAGGKIAFHFHARDLHLVLGPTADGKPVHFHITIDGKPPGEDHGVDVDAQGNGVITEHRLYQLVRQNGRVADHLFVIEFQDPGVQAYSFTFG